MMISSGKMTQARLNSVNCLSNAGSFNHHRLSIRGRPPVRSARSLTLGEGTRRGFLSSFRTRSASAHEELVKVSGHNGITTVSPEILEDHHLSYEEKLRLSSSAPNLGVHLANRLVEIGCTTAFGVPGDFNLLLLDQLLLHPELNVAWCCNELNAGYAADGYARKKGVGCAVVTFCVGGFSILNAVAGAYSEDLPVIVISGVPNTNDYSSNRILHHTIGLPDFNQQLQAFKAVTCHQVTINHIEDAHKLIDEAITVALQKSKPVYIEVSCNLASQSHPSFTRPPVPFILPPPHTNPHSVDAAVEAASKVLNSSVKPVLLAGPRIRSGPEREAFIKLADSSEYAVAILPDAKGMVPEDLATFIGLYWGAVSWPCVCEIVESADLVVTVGCVWTDYATVGYSLLLKPEKTISVSERRVVIRNGMTFGCITGADFMNQLADSVKPNPTAYTNFERMYAPPQPPARLPPNAPLTTAVMFKHIQEMLTPETDIISEVGDSWFNSQKLNLPPGCGYEMQMRYGSIGWSVGATLGYTTATKANITDICNVPPVFDSFTKKARVTENRRVISLIGDGSFQMTAQDVSTMLRYDLNPIIFLLNNASYTIEVQIHDGPYNAIMNWNYTALIESMNGGNGGKLFTAKVTKEEELEAAIAKALSPEHEKSLCFIEVVLHRDDCSKELLEWGARVATANGRPPQYH